MPVIKRVRQASLMNYLSLFGSFSTLICCALPSLLVLVGGGASVASALSVAPWLVTMSKHKVGTFAIAPALFRMSFRMTNWVAPRIKERETCIEDDPTMCGRVSKFSRMLLWGSATIWSFGFFMAYVLGDILEWYQFVWFRLLCGLLVIGAGCSLYLLRLRLEAASMKMRFDERLEERTRLARDLHDTLLQTIQGSRLVADELLTEPADSAQTQLALKRLAAWLDRATQEGRAALESLRISKSHDLVALFRDAAEECHGNRSVESTVHLVGSCKDMHPFVKNEVYRIGYEAVQNA